MNDGSVVANDRSVIGQIRRFDGYRSFRHRNYRLFFAGQLISLVGTWMQTVAQAWLVLQLTGGNPFALGLVAVAQFLPVLVFGLFGGLIADGLPKRATLVGTQLAAMILALALFALTATHLVTVEQVMVLALALGVVNAVDMPTRQSFAVEMVGREDVSNAVALNSAMFNAARIVGPAVAGLTIGAFGVSIAFLLNGLSYLAVIAGLLMMRDRDLQLPARLPRPRSIAAVGETLAEGLEYVRRTDVVLMAVVVVGLASLFGLNTQVLVPVIAQGVLHSDATGFGFLVASMGLGSVLAALAIAFSGRTGPSVIVLGAVAVGVFDVVMAASRFFPLSLAAMFFAGVGLIAMAATANTVIQLTVPDRLRGRVIAVYTTVFVGTTPFGGLLMGALAAQFGAPLALGFGGGVCTAVGIIGVIWLHRIQQRQVGHRPAATVSATATDAGR
ncbi:MAG TPA: MFS transporter [Candidatus Limnocylindrales bacterium]|jgi:MFS family permease